MTLPPPEVTLFLHPLTSKHLRSSAMASAPCPLIIASSKSHHSCAFRIILFPFWPIREPSLYGVGIPMRDEAGNIRMVLSGDLPLGCANAGDLVLETFIVHIVAMVCASLDSFVQRPVKDENPRLLNSRCDFGSLSNRTLPLA